MSSARDEKEQALFVPGSPCSHARTFNKGDDILFVVGIFECAVVAVQVIKGDIDDALHLIFLQRSLQYFTSSQFLAHFLRHSNSRPQRRQVLGSKPFLFFAMRPMGLIVGECFLIGHAKLTVWAYSLQCCSLGQLKSGRESNG
jgi:hypothetical protein